MDLLELQPFRMGAGAAVCCRDPVSPAEETMPDLRGLSYEAAKQALGSLGLYVTAGNGVTDAQIQLVSGQSIAPGQSVEHGTVIEVTLYENEASMLGIY